MTSLQLHEVKAVAIFAASWSQKTSVNIYYSKICQSNGSNVQRGGQRAPPTFMEASGQFITNNLQQRKEIMKKMEIIQKMLKGVSDPEWLF